MIEYPPGECIEWSDGPLGRAEQATWGGWHCQVHGRLHQVFNNQHFAILEIIIIVQKEAWSALGDRLWGAKSGENHHLSFSMVALFKTFQDFSRPIDKLSNVYPRLDFSRPMVLALQRLSTFTQRYFSEHTSFHSENIDNFSSSGVTDVPQLCG